MVKVLVDTSVFIEYFRTRGGMLARLIEEFRQGKIELMTSAIVVYELWKGESMKRKNVGLAVEELLREFIVLPFSRETGIVAGVLERKGMLKGYDAMIAASALEHEAWIATLNVKHFKEGWGLKMWKGGRG
jgi:predicted nucleic acid-binding protein